MTGWRTGFSTKRKGCLTMRSKEVVFNFAPEAPAGLPFMCNLRIPTDMYMSSFESLHMPLKLAGITRWRFYPRW